MKPTLTTAPLLVLIVAAGCASDAERAGPDDFGDSVRNMIALQTEGAGAAGTGLDGRKAEAVLRAYREDVAKPKEAERDLISFRLGQ